MNDKKIFKAFKKFARIINEEVRKENNDVIKVVVDADVFNDREMRMGYTIKQK